MFMHGYSMPDGEQEGVGVVALDPAAPEGGCFVVGEAVDVSPAKLIDLFSTRGVGAWLEDPMKENMPSYAAAAPAKLAMQIFRESPYQAIRDLRSSFHDGVLTLAGVVPSYYLKQLAQIAVRHLDGVKRISNLIEVSE
jgi:hypothetical protein